ncbi:DUF4235 domain-containing protein [Arthrobacter castelli]|uniref:DUF4235 domain-containing protein n=1 Tax=Arthrobacter castelli TaxID=271431 RepID=UPI000401C394|nr:DUF4235 domain-containing protein [Arthrobacter castelli]
MSVVYKLIGTGVTVGGTFVAKKLVSFGWKKQTGKNPPSATNDLEISWKEALMWGLLTACASTIIQVTAGRGTQRAIQKAEAKKEKAPLEEN